MALSMPREHGAYAQLLAPLVLELIASGNHLSAWLVAVAACCAFVANEPLLVLLGHRGKRVRDRDSSRAWRELAAFASVAVIIGILGLELAPVRAAELAALVVVPAVVLVALGWRKAQHTFAGELIAVAALTGAAAPVAAAGNIATTTVVHHWIGWAAGYACSVAVVHRVIARGKSPRSTTDLLLAFVVLGVAAALAATNALVGVPLALCAAIVAALAPRPAKLRTIGFVMVGASIVSIVLGLRA
jgi:hypothetical protein